MEHREGSSGACDATGDLGFEFRRIVAPRAHEEVIDQICDALLSGRFGVGSRLPRVADLAVAMGVSRPTVGEAVRALAQAGVLEVKRGVCGGITVKTTVLPTSVIRLSSRRVARSLSDVIEARRTVEMELARLAVSRATFDDLEQMRAANESLAASTHRPDEWASANYRFHRCIGRAARSELLAYFQREVTKEIAIFVGARSPRDVTNPEATVKEHREILAAFESRDLDRALAAVSAHLSELETMPTG